MISAQRARRAVWRPLWDLPRHFDLIRQLTRREVTARYRGSALGFVWALATPVLTIAIYTFIFAEFFGARFGARGTTLDYALYLYCGLLPWAAFQESALSSANVIVGQANMVKRVVFPLETMPVALALASIVNQLFGTVALIGAALIVRHELHATLLWLPVLLALQLLAMLGATWFVASLGVFVRDTAQGLALALTAWMFLTPIIYPEAIVPERYQPWISANPWTPLVRSYRRIFFEGAPPDWSGLAYFAAFALLLFIFGYWWFAKTRRNFADVI